MNIRWRRAWLMAGAAVFAAGMPLPGLADKITLQTGKTYDCDVIGEDATTVSIDLSDSNRALFGHIPRSQITAWVKSVHQGQPYVVLPISGTIGVDVTADGVKAGIARALKLKPKIIVFLIDSGGGNIGHLQNMVAALQAIPSDVTVVAFVQQAFSAAAVFAMSCPRIFLTRNAVLGAAVPFQHNGAGLPVDLVDKVKSALEAQQRTWVSAAGHDDLLLRGMMETDLEIYLSDDASGRPILSTSGPGKLLKGEDQILTLTAADAGECGLAQIAPDLQTAMTAVARGAVYEVSRRPGEAVIRVSHRERGEILRTAALLRIKPEIDLINVAAAPLAAKVAADKAAIDTLVSTGKQEMGAIDTEFQQDVEIAKHQSDPADAIAQAKQQRDARVQKVVENCNDAIVPLQAEMNDDAAQLKIYRDRVNQLMATVPDFVD
jgi:uncharacterized FlaG/YvyC family protein